ncbi:hypothetical protein MCOR02_002981 [Pyricularia oryzae]|uniref:Uncharacterized protein n=1 Tax=Pyricularia grisea TaxID=148305 RepID=A0ABQ8NA26_PYRGI|nr:hypothetical protein MCOR01_008760 [Pyricularia oryzae]KAI6293710.1 hypothetical protein MCOR33_008945 [Pyricularia grisea]KAH9439426.1 hypothetical protein MCOR02_002981 [Pyricularia oryzae]KAI6371387.1 hypothetical protein MCOR31_004158 [Pyricularia oryzae]KAI6398320.1 hypothetical protein MCOR23_005769 [Pyricularia oryzae]
MRDLGRESGKSDVVVKPTALGATFELDAAPTHEYISAWSGRTCIAILDHLQVRDHQSWSRGMGLDCAGVCGGARTVSGTSINGLVHATCCDVTHPGPFSSALNPSSSYALMVKIRPVAVAKLGVHSKPSQGGALALEESTVRRWWFVRDTLLPRSHPT